MEFRVLGPIEILSPAGPIDAGQPRQRGVLAALVADAGRFVTSEELVDRVWGPVSPPGARRALQSHVARIRRVLEKGDQPRARVISRTGGYLLAADPEQVDLVRFRTLVAQSGEPSRRDTDRAALLRDALGLWRGEPLAGMDGEWAGRMRRAWRLEYLEAAVAWARVTRDAGDAAAMVGPLRRLAEEHPLVEPLAAALMRALAMTERPAEALDYFARVRTQLAEELGTDPGPELRSVHQELLLGRSYSAETASGEGNGAATARSSPQVPAQLPLYTRHFAGRDEELRRLDGFLAAAGEHPGAVAVIVVSGTAGVGKTALALRWAHQNRKRFPDGQLYLNLRGFHPAADPVEPGDATRGILLSLGVQPERIPTEPDALMALYRTMLVDRRVIILLDNARDAEQVRPLLPGAGGCLVVVTSRDQLTGLVVAEGAYPLVLARLTPRDSLLLLNRRLGADLVAAEPRAATDIISRCARLPLALAVVAAHTALTGASLTSVAAGLSETLAGLDAFADSDHTVDLRAAFSWSLAVLTPDAARLFHFLGAHPGPLVSAPAAASLAALPVTRTRALLLELTRANLLIEQAPGRYTTHDLLRAYAIEILHARYPEDQRREVVGRLLDHYLHSAGAAAHLINRHRHVLPDLPAAPAGVHAEVPADENAALNWLDVEHPVLMAIMPVAATNGFDAVVCELAWVLADFLDRRRHWSDLARAQHAALDAARRLADLPAQARAHRDLGHANTRLGNFADARPHMEHAIRLYAGFVDPVGGAHAHHDLALLCEEEENHREALQHARHAHRLHRETGNELGQARTLNLIGWLHARLGDYRDALTTCGEALSLAVAQHDLRTEAATLDSLGYAHHHLGQHDQAVAFYRQAVDRFQKAEELYGEAHTLGHLGDTHAATGRHHHAQLAWRRALAILDELDHPDAAVISAKIDHSVTPARSASQ